MATADVACVITCDGLGYYADDGSRQEHSRGAKIALSKEDFERHAAAGAVEKPKPKKSAEVEEAAAEPAEPAE